MKTSSAALLLALACAAPAGAQAPSNLLAGDQILSTSCRGGFAVLSAPPGISAPGVSEGGSPATLSTTAATFADASMGGKVWCVAREPSNLQAGDVILSTSCRGGFASSTGPVISGTLVGGPPLASGGAGTAAVFPPAGRVWCAATEPSNLQAGDMIARSSCRGGWRASASGPYVQTAGVVLSGTAPGSYTFSNAADLSLQVRGGLWCVL